MNNINDLIQKVVDREMKGILRKITEFIEYNSKQAEIYNCDVINNTAFVNYRDGLIKAKQIILSSQKEVIHIAQEEVAEIPIENDHSYPQPKTKGDLIRESNERLLKILISENIVCGCGYCIHDNDDKGCKDGECTNGIVAYLMKKAEDE